MPLLHKNIFYWPSRRGAEAAIDDGMIRRSYPHARVVEYLRGYAVQIYKSGPYLPLVGDKTQQRNPMRRNPNSRSRKFDNTVEELLYHIDHDATESYDDGEGWWGMVSGLLKPEAIELAYDRGINAEEFANDAEDWHWPLNAIIHEDSNGFVFVSEYKGDREMMREWRRIQDMVYGTGY